MKIEVTRTTTLAQHSITKTASAELELSEPMTDPFDENEPTREEQIEDCARALFESFNPVANP